MAIKLKSWKTVKGMAQGFHPRMSALQMWLTTRYSEVVFTSFYRDHKIHPKDSGIAMTIPCRHSDIRSYIYEDPQSIVDDVNKSWIYDPKRPERKCAKYHDVGQGIHIHLQVHDNTLYVGGKA